SLVSTDTSVPLPRMSGLGPSESALLETILKEAPVGFAFFDTSARFQRVNPTLARLYGRAEEECIGRLPHDVLGEAAAEAHVAAVDRVLAGEPVVYGDQFPPFGPAGAQAARWAPSWFPTHGEGGEVDGVALIAVDLSDRLRAEGELRRSEERYRSLLEATNQVVWAADPDGAVAEDCPQWRAVTGQRREEYLGRGWLDSVHPDDRPRVERSWDDSIADRTVFDETFRVRTCSGDFRYFRSRAVPMMRGDELSEWVGANTDVTTQHAADAMRQALTVDQVVQAMGEIGRSAVGADRTTVAEIGGDGLRLRVIGRAGEPAAGSAPDHTGLMSLAVREQRPCIAGGPLELLGLLEEDEEAAAFVKATDERAWAALPLLSGGQPVGALRFAHTAPRDISDEEKVFLEALAGQCALALERAKLFEREHRTAEALQASLLPEALPEVQGIRMRSEEHTSELQSRENLVCRL